MTGRGGVGGHQSAKNKTDVWLTPPHILNALGIFNMDPCACSEPRPWSTARHHLTAEDNGLNAAWVGRIWLNPPYGGPNIITPWMRRMAKHGNGTAIIFARTETAMFHEYVWNAASAVLFLKGRLFFCRPDGVPAEHNGGAPSCLVAYGDRDAKILEECGLPGYCVKLKTKEPANA